MLLALLLCACAPADPLVGSYAFTMTGSDTTTSPTTSTASASGSGTLAVTRGLTADYVVVLGQNDTPACTLLGTKVKDKPLSISFDAAQKCQFNTPLSTVNAVLSTGALTLDSATQNTATLVLTYAYSGTAVFVNIAGNGSRTYTGSRF